MTRKEFAIVRKRTPKTFDGKTWTYSAEDYEVCVMTRVEGYAMVRRKGCVPFVVRESELTAPPTRDARND